ncbi:hypothetical protein [Myxacorys almedinensis]|uniref:Uncharacterized protein n=1 Tax=Myxacorys almedinensis A TaxID=2690445 RepID=A0A8J7ZDD5_9CYAN|nr:hypothetical protein [Myxacorys almedinensis A]
MKFKFALKACLTAGISILSIIPASIAHAGNGVPDYILEYQGSAQDVMIEK